MIRTFQIQIVLKGAHSKSFLKMHIILAHDDRKSFECEKTFENWAKEEILTIT